MKKHYSRVRVGVVFILLAMIFALFLARLAMVQIVRGDELRQKAKRQYQETIEIPAARGGIFDVKGNKVAANTCFKSLFAYPLTKQEITTAYRQLARTFGKSRSELKRKYRLSPKRFCWIKRRLSPEETARFENLDQPRGLYLREEPTRCYPYGTIGRGILGFVDLDNRGKAGVELVMDEYLSGSNGRSIIQKDGKGLQYPIHEVPLREAVAGRSVALTVDWNKQQIVEEELQRAVEKYNAKGGSAVFLDPYTGAVIAAADFFPDRNPTDKPMKLEAVAAVFEPGSVFKLITAAAVLEDGNIQPSDTFFAEEGRWKLGRHSLRDDHKYGWLTFRQGFEYSSNILIGKVANRTGGDKVLAMAKRFGFGRKTGCGLNGESRGVIRRPGHWSKFTTSTFAIGHGLSVTAIQMAQAFAVIASGGYLSQPYIVKARINDEGKVVERHRSRSIKILDDKIVSVLDGFLRGVIENGTGQPIADAPFPIAGKTGTAEKPNLETGGYHKNRFVASFAGYFPADSPLVAGVVVLDEPGPVHYGGYTAGPAFKNIAVKFGAIDNYQLIPPAEPSDERRRIAATPNGKPTNVILPDLRGMSPGEAKYKLKKLGLAPAFSGTEGSVLATFPSAFSHLRSGDQVRCVMGKESENDFHMPDLKGLTLREAVSVLDHYGLPFTCRGRGRVKDQKPKPGTVITDGELVKLALARNAGA